MKDRRGGGRNRRGAAAVAAIVLLLLLELMIVGMVLGGGREQQLTVYRTESVKAFYAAESGMNMSMRELFIGIDEDGDTGIGTIASTAIGDAQVTVTKVFSGTDWTLSSEGIAGDSQRKIESLLD